MGWENYSFLLQYSDGNSKSCLGRDSKFMKLYLSDMYLRPSCYKCQFKGIERMSDITIGDFWGVNHWKRIDNSDLQKGISIVVVHSVKGMELLKKSEQELSVWETSTSVFEKANIYIKKSAEKPYDIKIFKYLFERKRCDDIIQVYKKTNKVRKLIGKIKRKVKMCQEVINE